MATACADASSLNLTTTAISYTNGKPHIGHLYELLLADFLARKDETLLLTGTDEHGKKIEEVAKLCGETPFDFCTRHSRLFQRLADTLQVKYDRFIRTTDEDHKSFVQECILTSYAKDDIYLGNFEGWYSVREETFINEMDAKRTDYRDPVSGIPYEKLSEPAYFFRLSRYQDEVKKLLGEIDIQPTSALIHLKERLDDLKDICISRSTFTWGIPIPFDSSHVIYVWFDALLNYVTGSRSLGTHKGRHIIGKDILWFHTAIYLGILCSCNLLHVFRPEKIIVHGFVVDEKGTKMSKSLGNVVDVDYLLAKYPIDAIRFYFLTSAPFNGDFKFSEKELISNYNNILIKQFGNLFQRLFALIQPIETEINTLLTHEPIQIENTIRFHTDPYEYFNCIQSHLSTANLFLQERKPWTLEGDEKVRVVFKGLVFLLQAIRYFEPILPDKCIELKKYLGWDTRQIHLFKGSVKAFQPIPTIVKN